MEEKNKNFNPFHVAIAIFPIFAFLLGILVSEIVQSRQTETQNPSDWISIHHHTHHFDTLTKQELQNISTALRVSFAKDFPRVHEVRLVTSKAGITKRIVEVICRYPRPKSTFKVKVDVARSHVLDQEPYINAQPVLQPDEIAAAKHALRSDPLFLKIIEGKGLKASDVHTDEDTVGYWGDSESRRLISLEVYVSTDTTNWYARPLNLRFVVDLDTHEIVAHFTDPTVIPPSRGTTLDPPISSRKGPKRPVSMSQPKGVNFKINGSMVTWELWQFRLRLNQRVGPILSHLKVHDYRDNLWHSLAHEISMSEMFVPYMDVSDLWYFKTYFDIGEYGVGNLAQSLDHFSCGEKAYYLSFYTLNMEGGLNYLPNVTCIFERDTMDPVWHHGSPSDSIPSQTRKNLELVVRTIPMVGNYDYIIDFVFSLNGNMKIKVGATGSDAFKAGDPSGNPPMGAKVQEDLTAPFHDHFVNFRLDLDIDGPNNTFIVQKIKSSLTTDVNNRRKSRWYLEEYPVRFESEAQLKPHRETSFKISNPNGRAYEFVGTGSINQLLSSQDFPAMRASFTEHPLWITQYNQNEKFAAGEFPNQGACQDGLQSFSDKNRSLLNEDLVVWYSVGFHHLTRQEDFPVLNTRWAQFMLKPYNFFNGNVAINLTTDY